MTERLKSLRRIEAVQAQMVRLAQWRVAAAEQACRDHAADRERLRDYVSADGALGVNLAKAALKSIRSVDQRLAIAEREHAANVARLAELRRREHVVAAMATDAALAARRAAEQRDLATTIDAWLIGKEHPTRD